MTLSLLYLYISSYPSLPIVSMRTKHKGAKKVNRNPTLNGSMNWDNETIRKNKLKKNLNWLNRTTGTKLNRVYF